MLTGMREEDWTTVLAVGVNEPVLRALFREVELVRLFRYPMAREGVVEIYVCRHLQVDPAEAWSQLKRYR